MIFKDTQGHHNCCYYIDRIVQISLPVNGLAGVTTSLSVTFSKILPLFQLPYMTACDLEKSFTFDNKVYITSRVRFIIYV